MMDWFDKQGNPISVLEAGRKPHAYRRIDLTAIPSAGKVVSTVWLGLNMRFGPGAPLIFETMVFNGTSEHDWDPSDLDCDRYATEEEAREGHQRMVEKWSKPVVEEGDA